LAPIIIIFIKYSKVQFCLRVTANGRLGVVAAFRVPSVDN